LVTKESLRTLIISNNIFSECALDELAIALKSTQLSTLDMSNTNLTAKFALKILKVAIESTKIECLRIDSNKLGYSCGKDMEKLLRDNELYLKDLGLSYTSISSETIAEIKEILKTNKTLVSFVASEKQDPIKTTYSPQKSPSIQAPNNTAQKQTEKKEEIPLQNNVSQNHAGEEKDIPIQAAINTKTEEIKEESPPHSIDQLQGANASLNQSPQHPIEEVVANEKEDNPIHSPQFSGDMISPIQNHGLVMPMESKTSITSSPTPAMEESVSSVQFKEIGCDAKPKFKNPKTMPNSVQVSPKILMGNIHKDIADLLVKAKNTDSSALKKCIKSEIEAYAIK
jgi:hypothetical protein